VRLAGESRAAAAAAAAPALLTSMKDQLDEHLAVCGAGSGN